MPQNLSDDRDALMRLAAIVVCCLLFVALVWQGLWSSWRPLTLLTIASLFSAAVFYELASREASLAWTATSLAAIWTSAAISYLVLNAFDPPNPHWTGPLIAANEPMPLTACGGAKNSFLMEFGPQTIMAQGNGPFTPIQVGTCPALTLKRTAAGLMIDAFGYDSDGNVVYRIARNNFEMVLRGFLKAERPDKSTLRIVDELGNESLSVRYLNHDAVAVRGTFRCGDAPPLTIGDTIIDLRQNADRADILPHPRCPPSRPAPLCRHIELTEKLMQEPAIRIIYALAWHFDRVARFCRR